MVESGSSDLLGILLEMLFWAVTLIGTCLIVVIDAAILVSFDKEASKAPDNEASKSASNSEELSNSAGNGVISGLLLAALLVVFFGKYFYQGFDAEAFKNSVMNPNWLFAVVCAGGLVSGALSKSITNFIGARGLARPFAMFISAAATFGVLSHVFQPVTSGFIFTAAFSFLLGHAMTWDFF